MRSKPGNLWKNMLSLCLAGLLLCLAAALSSCGQRAPELAEVYDRLVELIDRSVDVNVLLYGAGLPVYGRGTAEDALIHRYYGVADNGTVYVTPYARYAAVEDMKTAIAEVYSDEYAQSMIETLFTGYILGDGSSGMLPARYQDSAEGLLMSEDYEPLVSGVRIFDYSSMDIQPSSTSDYLRVSIRSRSDAPDSQWQVSSLCFVKQNGTWYLDGPSC